VGARRRGMRARKSFFCGRRAAWEIGGKGTSSGKKGVAREIIAGEVISTGQPGRK